MHHSAPDRIPALPARPSGEGTALVFSSQNGCHIWRSTTLSMSARSKGTTDWESLRENTRIALEIFRGSRVNGNFSNRSARIRGATSLHARISRVYRGCNEGPVYQRDSNSHRSLRFYNGYASKSICVHACYSPVRYQSTVDNLRCVEEPKP